MLHPLVLAELLDDELAAAQARLAGRLQSLDRRDADVLCRFTPGGGAPVTLRLAGRAYDGEPFRLAIVDDQGRLSEAQTWPAGLNHGIHPVLGIPFACVQGTYEYHCHPSHLSDAWDCYRPKLRLADLLDHLLRKCGT